MKQIYGLLIALVALFFVWLWATGRVKSVWSDVITPGSSAKNAGAQANTQAIQTAQQPFASFASYQPADLQSLAQSQTGLLSQIGTLYPTVQPTGNGGTNLANMMYVPQQLSFQIPQYISSVPVSVSVPNSVQVGGQNGVNVSGLAALLQSILYGNSQTTNPPVQQPQPQQGVIFA